MDTIYFNCKIIKIIEKKLINFFYLKLFIFKILIYI